MYDDKHEGMTLAGAFYVKQRILYLEVQSFLPYNITKLLEPSIKFNQYIKRE